MQHLYPSLIRFYTFFQAAALFLWIVIKYKYGRRVFWAKGYYVNTVGGNEARIRKYIQEQEFNDQMCDQLSFKEYEDPFKNAADFDDDDSPEVPADSMRK